MAKVHKKKVTKKKTTRRRVTKPKLDEKAIVARTKQQVYEGMFSLFFAVATLGLLIYFPGQYAYNEIVYSSGACFAHVGNKDDDYKTFAKINYAYGDVNYSYMSREGRGYSFSPYRYQSGTLSRDVDTFSDRYESTDCSKYLALQNEAKIFKLEKEVTKLKESK